ncbi:MAG: energy transducer TonB, partial [Proteobacteria bacterium]|nr:energy transducer TonB [Pseudomonadota bacterium]
MKRIITILAASLLFVGSGAAIAQDDGASSMAELLNLIQQGQARDSREARQREAQFTQRRGEQQNLLNQSRSERNRQERQSSRLEQLFKSRQTEIVAARAALDERLGALKELFGVLQTVSGDTQGRFNSSLTNLQFPDREEFLVALGSKMASATELASIEDIERLWFELHREIVESGKIVRFNHLVFQADGQQAEQEIIRVGL